MAGSVNKVTLVGNVGQDPEVRQFSNDGQEGDSTLREALEAEGK